MTTKNQDAKLKRAIVQIMRTEPKHHWLDSIMQVTNKDCDYVVALVCKMEQAGELNDITLDEVKEQPRPLTDYEKQIMEVGNLAVKKVLEGLRRKNRTKNSHD
jgi:hypothetical protein